MKDFVLTLALCFACAPNLAQHEVQAARRWHSATGLITGYRWAELPELVELSGSADCDGTPAHGCYYGATNTLLVNMQRTPEDIQQSVLHELGAISIINSDSQGMGRIAEVIRRTWQLAHQMKRMRGEQTHDDNARILKYLAKYTINPARAHGIDREVGSL